MVVQDGHEVDAVPSRNTAPDPVRHFRLDLAQWFAAVQAGNLLGYYHSHPEGTEAPSDRDIEVAEHVGLPAYVYSLQTDRFACYRPMSYRRRQTLQDRPFLAMANDALTLVEDYFFFRHNITISQITRNGARLVVPTDFGETVATPGPSDILVMYLRGATQPNHLGIYLGDGQFLHQPCRSPSRNQAWEGFWRRATTRIIRIL